MGCGQPFWKSVVYAKKCNFMIILRLKLNLDQNQCSEWLRMESTQMRFQVSIRLQRSFAVIS